MDIDKTSDSEKSRGDYQPQPMIQGDWTCSECGGKITELRFEPAPDRPVYCKACWAQRRTQSKG